MSVLTEISEMMQKGKSKETVELVNKAIAEGLTAQEIIDDGLMPGMSIIGERFKNNDIFVPEVLIAARAMGAGTDVLKPLLAADATETKGTVVLGTIKDDLHDIGKNLVGMMMESKGLTVVDLGNNVDPATYVKAAKEHNADLIGCSAMLTTTMLHMKDVVNLLNDSEMAGKTKVMVGGAPLTQVFCESIGADFYVQDASNAADKAVEYCNSIRG
ncbi:corrinoid protein [Desulforhopalus sp. 52FAK]